MRALLNFADVSPLSSRVRLRHPKRGACGLTPCAQEPRRPASSPDGQTSTIAPHRVSLRKPAKQAVSIPAPGHTSAITFPEPPGNVSQAANSASARDRKDVWTSFAEKTSSSGPERAVWDSVVAGHDALICSKHISEQTGLYLMAVLYRYLNSSLPPRMRRGIRVLVLCPSASRSVSLGDALKRLLSNVPGASVRVDADETVALQSAKWISGSGAVLVSTPERFLEAVNGKRDDCLRRLAKVETVVVDDVGTLLDMGYESWISDSLKALSVSNERQTILLSSSRDGDVNRCARAWVRPNVRVMDGISPPSDSLWPVDCQVQRANDIQDSGTLGACLESIVKDPHARVIVFCPTGPVAQAYAEAWNELHRKEGSATFINTRMPQKRFGKVLDEFSQGTSGLLFCCDLSARLIPHVGGVTHVVQFGRPTNREQYLARMGRVSRVGGRIGTCLLIVGEQEADGILSKVRDLPVHPLPPVPSRARDAWARRFRAAYVYVNAEHKRNAYEAFIGFYRQFFFQLGGGWTNHELIRAANHWVVADVGEARPPALDDFVAGSFGLRRVAGVRIAPKKHPRGGELITPPPPPDGKGPRPRRRGPARRSVKGPIPPTVGEDGVPRHERRTRLPEPRGEREYRLRYAKKRIRKDGTRTKMLPDFRKDPRASKWPRDDERQRRREDALDRAMRERLSGEQLERWEASMKHVRELRAKNDVIRMKKEKKERKK